MHPKSGINVLDIGCGNGKQIFALHDYLKGNVTITGIDISSEAIDEINEKVVHHNYTNIFPLCTSFETINSIFPSSSFDLIISSYAIYYSKDVLHLLQSMKDLLTRNGEIFICGPGNGTNREINDIILTINARYRSKTDFGDFFTSEEITSLSKVYSIQKTCRLHNYINFESSGEIMKWWRNHVSYIPEIDALVEKAIDDFIAEHGTFTLSKNTLAIYFKV